jgi:hypothetical protein
MKLPGIDWDENKNAIKGTEGSKPNIKACLLRLPSMFSRTPNE